MRRRILSALILLTAFVLIPVNSSGYVTWVCLGEKLKWDSNSVRMRASAVSFPAGSWRTALGDAVSLLNRHPSNFNFNLTYDEPGVKRGNGENEIWFSSDPSATGGAPAITWTWYDCVDYWIFGTDVELTETDIVFNVGESYTTSTSKSALWEYGGGGRPFRNTAIHELGHALGLAHEADEYNIMGTDWTHIHVNGFHSRAYFGEDASDGAVYLYGTDSSAGEDLSVVHWRHTGHSGEYSTHGRTRIFNTSNVELAKNTISGEPVYRVDNGQTIKVEFSYENNGKNRQNPVGIGIYLSTNDTISTWDDRLGGFGADLGRNDVWTTSCTVTLPSNLTSNGYYYIGAVIDENGLISEFDETNNATYTRIRVNAYTPTPTPTWGIIVTAFPMFTIIPIATPTPTPWAIQFTPLPIFTLIPFATPTPTPFLIPFTPIPIVKTPIVIKTPFPGAEMTPTPKFEWSGCVEAGDFYKSAQMEIGDVDLGWVKFTQPYLSRAEPAPLSVVDCSQDGRLDVLVPWSAATASPKAAMHFSTAICDGKAPQVVEVTLTTGTSCLLEAINDAGDIVDKVEPASLPINITATITLPTGEIVSIVSGETQTVRLSSATGIRQIQITGSEICISKVCWLCQLVRPTPIPTDTPTPTPTQTPTRKPVTGECVKPGMFYTAPVNDISPAKLGLVEVHAAKDAKGNPVPLDVTDCSRTGELGVWVPWSGPTAPQRATIVFPPELCKGSFPQLVEVVLMHFSSCTLRAFDSAGALVDTAVAAPGPAVQTLTLSSASGIRKVEIEGAEICILEICWTCGVVERTPVPTPTSTPTIGLPSPGGCVEPGDIYTAPVSALADVNLGLVGFRQASLPDGTPVPLSVVDCSGDGHLDIFVPWSEASAAQKARIYFSANICGGKAPQVVQVVLTHGTLYAMDDTGAVVDKAQAVPGAGVQTLTLSSASGIRVVEIQGSEICILKVCWICVAPERTPEPTPTSTPTVGVPPTEGCVEAGDFYTAPASNLPTVNLGRVEFKQGYLPDGTPDPLSVRDCSGDGRLDVFVPWSEATALQKATISFSCLCPLYGGWQVGPGGPGGDVVGCVGPELVEVVLVHYNSCTLYAFDDAGAMVDSAVAGAQGVVQTLTLYSPTGIAMIQIEGAEICILKVCWKCTAPERTPVPIPTVAPTLGPAATEGCVEAGDIYTTEARGLASVNLGWVEFRQGYLPDGTPDPLSVRDCSGDGRLDVFVPWSEASASQKATIFMSPNLCGGRAPSLVEVVLVHYNSCLLYAIDDSGAMVGNAVAGAQGVVQTLTLSSPTGIRLIQIEGSEICILKVCWKCAAWPTPNCVEPGDIYTAEARGLATVNLGWVEFRQGSLPDGTPVALDVVDCSGDGRLDVSVPWSEATAAQKATIFMSPNLCGGRAPEVVEVVLTQGNYCILRAMDDSGAVVNTATATGTSAEQTLLLLSTSGIRVIEIEGSEICILRVCWMCVAPEVTGRPTPTPTSTPTIGRPPTEGCVEAGDIYTTEARGLASVNLGWAEFTQGYLPDGTPVPLNIIDCSHDGRLDISVPWSETSASQKATIRLSASLCGGKAPEVVEVVLINGNYCILRAMDDSGAVVDTTKAADTTAVQTLTLSSTSGIRVIEIDGSEICILKVCWTCSALVRTPTPTYTCYPDLPGPGLVLKGTEEYEESGTQWTRYNLGVSNWNVYPDELFDPAPDLPPCGLNTNSARTWVDIFNGDNGDRIYGFCALGSASDLNSMWFSVPQGQAPPPSIYVVMMDRRCDITYTSEIIPIVGSGFIFTSVGKIPVTEIVQDNADLSFGLAKVSDTAVADYHIPKYTDSPFGGYLWIRGLFGALDDVDYYQIIATSEDGTKSFALSDPLTKTYNVIESPTGTVKSTHVQLGPETIGDVSSLYKLNKNDGGYWSQEDLRIIWNTTGLNGRYRLDYKAYQLAGPNAVSELSLDPNDLDHLTLWIDSSSLSVKINSVKYADGSALLECEDIILPHNGSSQLVFDITANHGGGFLRYYFLNCYWGHNNFGGRFTYDQYVGSHDVPPPDWPGVLNEVLPPLSPRDLSGNVMPWEDCAYRFYLEAGSRTTDGNDYLQYGSWSVYHAVETVAVKAGKLAQEPPCTDCPAKEMAELVTSAIVEPLAPIPADISSANGSVVQALPTVFPDIMPVFTPLPFPFILNSSHFVDTWVNVDPNTGGITRIIIGKTNGDMTVHAFGACVPTDCDMGTIVAPYTGNPFTAVYEFWFKTDTLTIELLDYHNLHVHSHNVFHDGSGRDYDADYYFHRETIWVDDDNTSATEDGTRLHPYNTISEGISAAISRQIVRVLPGHYAETVDMKAGVSVIGSGADSTVIDPGSTSSAVRCISVGAGAIFSGFRITNAGTGIYCHSSSLSLRENVITNINPASLGGDGIRLDDSSPLIQNNLIYHVGGMGIRGQGNSGPTIINNTIYDYGYYAGISFSALNIGAVSPIIKNNIVVRGNSAPVGGILYSHPASAIISYNNVYGPANVTGGGSYYAYHDGAHWNEVSGGTGAVSADPLFMDVAHGDFHLDPTSPCVDAGDPAAEYNDLDGSCNDMGAFGGQRLETTAPTHSGSGFMFTSIGNIPTTEIVADKDDPSHGLLRVSDEVANSLHVHKFTDAAFGGYLWIRGLFGTNDDVDYYQVLAAPYGTSATAPLSDPLVKTKFTIDHGTVTATRVQMGPLTVGGVSNLYTLNKEGLWTFTDLRYIWNTTGLNGKYNVTYKAYRLVGENTLQEVSLPANDLDHFTIQINNRPVEFRIDSITYADHMAIEECEKIVFPHAGSSSLIFTITAWHADGFLRDYRLNCYWGNNRYGGDFTSDQYVGSHDAPPPSWQGVFNQELPPLLPRDSTTGAVMDWHTCPYHFYLSGYARITDGIHYLVWGSDSVYQSVVTTGVPATPTAIPIPPTAIPIVPTDTPSATPTPTNTPTPSVTPAPMMTWTPSVTPIVTVVPMVTPTPTVTPTPAVTAVATPDQIILSQGHGGTTSNKIIRADRSRVTSFQGLPIKFAEQLGISTRRSTNAVAADVDGDGAQEIVVGFGPGGRGSKSPSIVVVWKITETGAKSIASRGVFSPSAANARLQNRDGALNLAVGRFVDDGLPMIVAAQGQGGSNQIRLLQYAETALRGGGKLVDVATFQGFEGAAAQNNKSGGTSVAAGDVDKDGLDELIIGQMNGAATGFTTLFQVLDFEVVDGAVKVARRTPGVPLPGMPRALRGLGGVNLAVGDIDGDGENEIIAATAGGPAGGYVRAFDVAVDAKNRITSIKPIMNPKAVFGAAQNPSGGLSIATANVDDDPADELLAGTQAILMLDETTGEVTFTSPAPRVLARALNFHFNEDGTFAKTSDAIPPFEAFGGAFAPTSGAVNVARYPIGVRIPIPIRTPIPIPTRTPTSTVTPTPTSTLTPSPTVYIPPQLGWVRFEAGAAPGDRPRSALKEETTMGLMIHFRVPGMYALEEKVGDVMYHRLSIPGYGKRIELGKPELPILGQVVEIPYGVNLSVEIFKSKSIELPNYNVIPAQVPDIEQDVFEVEEFALDKPLYATDAYYPLQAAEIQSEDIGVIRGHRLAFVKVNPLLYNPVTKIIRAFSEIEVQIRYSRPAQITRVNNRIESAAFEDLLEASVINYKHLERFPLPGLDLKVERIGCDYLIITAGAFYSTGDPNNPIVRLRDWKQRKGLKTKVVDVANIPGGVSAANIRNYLQTAYDTWYPVPTYVLLVGDADLIPPDYQTPHGSHGNTLIGTDLYYATLDGADYFPDIMVGRISVETVGEAEDVVDKILAYEQNPPADPNFYEDTSLVRLFEDDDPSDGQEDDPWILIELAEELRDFLLANGYDADRIYDQSGTFAQGPLRYEDGTNIPANLTIAGGFPWDGDTADILNAFNNGNFLITYRGHGARDGWSRPAFDTGDFGALTNGDETPVIFGLTCQTGWFDNETDAAALGTAVNDDCFAELIVRESNNGAVAIVASTRNSWGYCNNPITTGMCDALWPTFDTNITSGPLYKMGQIMTYGKVCMAHYVPHDNGRQITFEMSHLFGDPEMPVWTEEPEDLKVEHPASIGSTGQQDFVVLVMDDASGDPVQSAVVALTRTDIVAVAQTNAGGVARFTLSAPAAGDLDITVTAHNYRPYEGTIEVSASGAVLNRLEPADGMEGSTFYVGGQNFSGGENVDIYFGDQLVKTVAASGGSFGQSGVQDVNIDVPSPHALGPVNVRARGQTSHRSAVDVFQVRTANPIDLYIYDQWDSTTWHLHAGDNPTWNNPEIQLYDDVGNPVESNNLTVAETYTIKARIHNDTDFDADGVKVTLKWADWGIAQPDRVWNDIDTDTIDVPHHDTEEAEVHWAPPSTGHLCVMAEIYHIEDINEDNNKGQENCHVGPTSSPAEVSFDVWNPTEEPAMVFLELRQLVAPGQEGRRLWGSAIKQPDPQLLEPGKAGQAVVIIDPNPADVKTGEKAEFALTGFINGKMYGGINLIIIKK